MVRIALLVGAGWMVLSVPVAVAVGRVLGFCSRRDDLKLVTDNSWSEHLDRLSADAGHTATVERRRTVGRGQVIDLRAVSDVQRLRQHHR